MQFKRIETPSLALYSYFIAEGQQAAVIDPRTDIRAYLDASREFGTEIIAIFETHRNEDFISGASALAAATGAPVFRSAYEDLGQNYGEMIDESYRLKLGDWTIRPLHTPGHTLGHLSYLLEHKGNPYMLFSGDTLFYGDVGRSDFYGEEQLEKVTGLLYDSIFKKILPLGDEVILMPAHGAGSACGGKIEERPSSTLGYEKAHSPALDAKNKAAFVKRNGIMHPKPPYMELMEKANLMAHLPRDWAGMAAVAGKTEGRHLVDIRSRRAFLGGHLPGSLWMRTGILNAHLGWQVTPGRPLTFITEGLSAEDIAEACLVAACMGYQDQCIYPPGMLKVQEVKGEPLQAMTEIDPKRLLEERDLYFVVDVREQDEHQGDDPVAADRNIPVGKLKEHLSELKPSPLYATLCGSGERATVAASVLEKAGLDVRVIAGGNRALRNLKGLP